MAPRILGRVSAARKSRQFVARINLVAIGAIADMARADSYQLIDLCQRERRLGPSRPLQPIRKDLVIRFRRQRLAREAIMAAKEISVKKYVVTRPCAG